MIRYQKMKADHVDGVAELEKLCFSDPWSRQSVESELNNPLSLWVVAVEENAVVGYVGSQSVLGESDMMNLAVRPDRRRQGIAEALVEFLISELSAKGNYALLLEVRASNAPAIALYQKLGFGQVGLRKNYYRNPKEDAIIMKRTF